MQPLDFVSPHVHIFQTEEECKCAGLARMPSCTVCMLEKVSRIVHTLQRSSLQHKFQLFHIINFYLKSLKNGAWVNPGVQASFPQKDKLKRGKDSWHRRFCNSLK